MVRFYNSNLKDKVLDQIYPLFEGDTALGQKGAQKIPYYIKIPTNFDDIQVTGEIKPTSDADGIEADVYGLCNNNNTYCTIKNEGWDLGFCIISPFIHPKPPLCQNATEGDNHAGYQDLKPR